jgi:predicted dehydrogenase
LRAAGFEVLALVGRDRAPTEHKARQLEIPAVCASLPDALELGGIDAVAIATPPDTHFELALQALDAGRHVLCEKPFTVDSDQAAKLVDAARRVDVVAAIGHEFRWNPARAAMGDAIAAGALGDVRTATIVEYSPFLHNAAMQMPNWFHESGIGGWLGASGSHMLDQLRLWLGPVESVSARLSSVDPDGAGAEDSYSARCRHTSGAESVIQQIGAAWTARSLTVVTGTHATAGIDDEQAWIADRAGVRDLPTPAGTALPGAKRADDGNLGDLGAYELRHYERLCVAFGAAINGRPTDAPAPLPTFADGLAVMRCMDAIRASSADGGRLHVVDQT